MLKHKAPTALVPDFGLHFAKRVVPVLSLARNSARMRGPSLVEATVNAGMCPLACSHGTMRKRGSGRADEACSLPWDKVPEKGKEKGISTEHSHWPLGAMWCKF